MKKTNSVEETIKVAGIPCGSTHIHTHGYLNNKNNEITKLEK